MRAVAIGFGLPFLLMVITVFVTQKLTGNETLAAGLSVAVLMPYYLIIYLMREKLKRRFSFTVE
jgi:sigma-E factor negative regulatory protein RseC